MTTVIEDRIAEGLPRLRSTAGGRSDERRLERVLLLAVVLVASCTTWLLATAQDASGDTAPLISTCVSQAVDGAQAFAGVLGDHRPVDGGFADRWCRDEASRP